jgi:protein SCO1
MIEEVKEVSKVYETNRWPARVASRMSRRGVAACLLLLCALLPARAFAQHQHAHDPHAAPHAPRVGPEAKNTLTGRPGVVEVGRARLVIPDVEVLDQDGRRLRFYSDLIKGKVVVINFFFTSCTLVCPMQGRSLARLGAELKGRLGQEVFFISVSKDPLTDTPERLKLWGRDYGVGPGWTLVTGGEGVMSELVRDFTGASLGGQDHSPTLLIGNDRTGRWAQAEGLAAATEIVKNLDRVAGR